MYFNNIYLCIRKDICETPSTEPRTVSLPNLGKHNHSLNTSICLVIWNQQEFETHHLSFPDHPLVLQMRFLMPCDSNLGINIIIHMYYKIPNARYPPIFIISFLKSDKFLQQVLYLPIQYLSDEDDGFNVFNSD